MILGQAIWQRLNKKRTYLPAKRMWPTPVYVCSIVSDGMDEITEDRKLQGRSVSQWTVGNKCQVRSGQFHQFAWQRGTAFQTYGELNLRVVGMALRRPASAAHWGKRH